MRVLIFGSTGLAGRYILAELLAQNHDVIVFVRSRNRIDSKLLSSSKLTIVEGDGLSESDIKHAFTVAQTDRNLDAIISSINEGLEIKLHLQSKCSRLILNEIDRCTNKKPRFIVFAGAGLLDVPIEGDNHSTEIKTQFWKYSSEYPTM
ncbi:unnamed protein product [Adineta ricciae]|uniref:NAD(P)-binding domain-containing protein n=1 Tax=Adineta ricciae TaxID=249248 RepID=A0A816A1W4_ADIRI|nr:unnamed protein product [Adineta ricciae]CAF1592288.1 unnamed protein product [Adineta ricciae]